MKCLVPLLCLPFCFFLLGCENPRVEYNPYNPTVNRPVDNRPMEDKVQDFRDKVDQDLREMQ